ncbi:discoidin domain-containing protein [Bacteroides sp. 51]|uniref:discoidin domain-containing protein n=1 Tax=Bacteroides sp. 51 TaxID=2302938 RepID=UPI0013D2615B|nr:discoidin domain-containing protein [Bacteroides sp. 51]NDV84227.1 hypothetical protein [Bacteroides sp. 51]
MNNSIFTVTIITTILTLVSCDKTPNKLENALQLSGENQSELKKVIDHYSENESDSLKLQAAIFLIENMPGHYSVSGSIVDKHARKIEEEYHILDDNLKKVILTVPFRKGKLSALASRTFDLEVIKAEYLISIIDNAIEKWESCYWLEGIPFESFCEYVLPYRLDYEPLFPYNDSLMTAWRKIDEELKRYPDYRADLKEVWNYEGIYAEKAGRSRSKDQELIRAINKSFNYDCFDEAFYEVINMRASGIPSTIDLVPAWANRNSGHSWKVILDPKYMNQVGNIHGQEVHSMAGKIYRITYSHNPIPKSNGKDMIPAFFLSPFHKDVTTHYVNTSDVCIDLHSIPNDKPDHLYLSVFNTKEWKPIAWSNIKQGRATFENMETGIIYLPVYYKEKDQASTRFPFLLGFDGRTTFFEPDTSNCTSIYFVRKYPISTTKLNWNKFSKDHRFEASRFPDFRDAELIYYSTEVNPILGYTTINIPDKNKTCRYWRVISDSRIAAIGEIEFFNKNGNKLTGNLIKGDGENESVKNAFDNDVLTFAKGDVWYGLDLGDSVEVNQVRYIPRTDANNIFPGHTYELLYYDNGWISVEVQEATDEYLQFHNVPSNAVYWLRNLTEGIEERVFIYRKGKIIWY